MAMNALSTSQPRAAGKPATSKNTASDVNASFPDLSESKRTLSKFGYAPILGNGLSFQGGSGNMTV
jgi:hypothetical protein